MQATWLAALAALTFVTFAQAIRSLFSRPDGMPGRMRWTANLGVLGAVSHVVLIAEQGEQGSARLAVAGGLYLGSLGLFAWARQTILVAPLPIAFSSSLPARIVTTGPYAVMRHPFYIAYAIAWLAGVIAVPSLWTATPALVMTCFYISAARSEERALLNGPHAAAYRGYLEGRHEGTRFSRET